MLALLIPDRSQSAECGFTTLLPARRRGLDDVRSDVGDVLLRQAAAERGHRILTVRDLLHDRLIVEAAVEVLLESLR